MFFIGYSKQIFCFVEEMKQPFIYRKFDEIIQLRLRLSGIRKVILSRYSCQIKVYKDAWKILNKTGWNNIAELVILEGNKKQQDSKETLIH